MGASNISLGFAVSLASVHAWQTFTCIPGLCNNATFKNCLFLHGWTFSFTSTTKSALSNLSPALYSPVPTQSKPFCYLPVCWWRQETSRQSLVCYVVWSHRLQPPQFRAHQFLGCSMPIISSLSAVQTDENKFVFPGLVLTIWTALAAVSVCSWHNSGHWPGLTADLSVQYTLNCFQSLHANLQVQIAARHPRTHICLRIG